MQLYEYKPFQKQVSRLARTGGAADMAYQQVVSAINNWRHRLPATLARTKNGENRIPHAVKYDLHGAHRLVTVEHENARVLLFVGSHDDAERWLDKTDQAYHPNWDLYLGQLDDFAKQLLEDLKNSMEPEQIIKEEEW